MQVAIGYALANQMGAEDVARFIADAFLKALTLLKPVLAVLHASCALQPPQVYAALLTPLGRSCNCKTCCIMC